MSISKPKKTFFFIVIISLLFNLFILLIAAVVWIAVLWFGISLNYAAWNPGALIALHVVPPLLTWGSWRLMHSWLIRRRKHAAQERDAKVAAEQQKKMDEIHQRHLQELATRHFHCECRAIAMQAKAAAPEMLFDIDLPNVKLQLASAEGDESDEFEALEKADPALAIGGFAPLIYETLLQLYDNCPAAIVLPIYVAPPEQGDLVKISTGLRRIHKEIVEAMEPVPTLPNDATFVRFLHCDDNMVNAVLSVFEDDPALPGAVILAFDSPLVQAQATGLGATPQEKWAGPPSQGVIAMLMTAAGLSPLLAQSLQDRKVSFGLPRADLVTIKLLSHASRVARKQLMELPVMAQIRRSASISLKSETQSRRPELHNKLTTLLERAKTNAGLSGQPLIPDDEVTDKPAASDSAKADEDNVECGWLIHNAGSVDAMGPRLAATATAMTYHKINIDPLDEATNVAIVLGNFGKATGIGMLALSTMQSAMLKQEVLCTDFNQAESASMFFVVPPSEEEPKDAMQEAVA